MFSSSFLFRRPRPAKRPQAQRSRPTIRPHLEALEERTLLNSRFVAAVGAPIDNATSFATLQAALTTPGLNAGDVIQIEPGAAPGDVNLNTNLPPVANLTIQGDPAAGLASVPQFTLSDAFTVQAAQTGFTLKNVNVGLIGNGGVNFLANGSIARSTIVDISSMSASMVSVTRASLTLTGSALVNNSSTPTQFMPFLTGHPVLLYVVPGAGSANLIRGNVFTANTATTFLVADQTTTSAATTDQVSDNAFIANAGSGLQAMFSESGFIDGLQILSNTFTDPDPNATAISLSGRPTNAQIGANVIRLTGAGSTGVSFADAGAGLSALVAGNEISTNGVGTGLSITLPAGRPSPIIQEPTIIVQGNDFHGNQIGVYINAPSGPPGVEFDHIDLGGGPEGSLGGNDFRGIPVAHFVPGPIVQGEGTFLETHPGSGSGAIVVEGIPVAPPPVIAAHQNLFSGDPRNAVFDSAVNSTVDTSGALTGNAAFVASAYDQLFKRAGDVNNPNDAGAWINQLYSGALTQAAVANDLAHSQEKAGQLVDGLYLLLLNRPADADGRASDVLFLRNGGSVEQVAQQILSSPEYTTLYGSDDAFVQSLYSKLLGRSGAAGDAAAWVNALPVFGRAGVASAFLHSLEFRGDVVQQLYGTPAASAATVAGLFPSLLHRMGSPAEVNGWVNSSLDLLSIEADFGGDGEFALPG